MTDMSAPGQRTRDWRRLARKWWPALAVGVAALILSIWAIAGRGESAATTAADSAVAHAEDSDSLVTLDSTALRLAGIELVTAGSVVGDALVANGTITYDANHVSAISSRAEGRVLAVRADLGQPVQAGQILALVESSEVGEVRSDLERARANVDIARRNYEREKRLFDQQITSQKELLEAESALRSAEADYNSAASRLRGVGASGGEGAAFGLVSPIAGVVVERNASPGQVIGPSTTLFTVANLRHVWITVDVYEADLSRVRLGAPVAVMPSALSGATFAGRVTYAGGIVDPASRTFKVRVELENQGLRLRPGMYAQVRIATPRDSVSPGAALTVPEIAVQEIDGKQVVFVALSTPGRFVARTVTLGPRSGAGLVTVESGLSAGERIVGRGAFQLKAEMQKASFGEEH